MHETPVSQLQQEVAPLREKPVATLTSCKPSCSCRIRLQPPSFRVDFGYVTQAEGNGQVSAVWRLVTTQRDEEHRDFDTHNPKGHEML